MNIIKWIVAGGVVGLLGAGLWAVVTKLTGIEFGFIAWLIGGAVGLAVKSAAADEADWLSATIAAVIAVAAAVGGRYATLHAYLSEYDVMEIEHPDPAEHWEPIAATLAMRIASEWTKEGREIDWPENSARGGFTAADYPPDLWDEALRHWHDLTPEERQAYAATLVVEVPMDAHAEALRLFPRYSVMGAVFLVLAGATAFKLGGDFGG